MVPKKVDHALEVGTKGEREKFCIDEEVLPHAQGTRHTINNNIANAKDKGKVEPYTHIRRQKDAVSWLMALFFIFSGLKMPFT